MPSSARKKKNGGTVVDGSTQTVSSTQGTGAPDHYQVLLSANGVYTSWPTIVAASTNAFFVFNDTATTEIYTLSLHDALPIYPMSAGSDRDRVAVAYTKAGDTLA